MTARFAERTLWVASFVMVAWSAWRWNAPAQETPPGKRVITKASQLPRMFDPDSLADAAEDATDHNLFREDRERTPDRIMVERPASPLPTQRPAVPMLTLRGIVGGPPWDVIIDGIPGRPAGTVLRDGESVAGFTITVTARDAIRIKGADTAWTLFFRR